VIAGKAQWAFPLLYPSPNCLDHLRVGVVRDGWCDRSGVVFGRFRSQHVDMEPTKKNQDRQDPPKRPGALEENQHGVSPLPSLHLYYTIMSIIVIDNINLAPHFFLVIPWADGMRHFAERLHGAFRLAIASRAGELKRGCDLDRLGFIVTHMAESLSHGALFRRPPRLWLADAKAEIVRAVMAYLQA